MSSGLVSKTFAVLAKDVRIELRTRYVANTILMFAITSLAIVSFSVGQANLSPRVHAVLYWIILFFSAMAALSHVFVREEEAGTAMALRLTALPQAVYLGKLAINILLMSMVTLVVCPLFFVFTDASLENVWGFVGVTVVGVLSICAATTLVAAIVSRAAVKGTLFAVLCFPLLILPLMMLVQATAIILVGAPGETAWVPIQGLIAYTIAMFTASYILFRVVWHS